MLFLMPDRAQRIGSHLRRSRFIETLVAAGQQLVGDVMSGACPLCQSPTAEEFGVVGMREDDENVLGGIPGVRFHVSGVGDSSKFLLRRFVYIACWRHSAQREG